MISRALLATLVFITLTGCRDQGSHITVFQNLPQSKYTQYISTAIEDKQPIAITFTAPWCPHCQKYKPTFFEVKEEYDGEVTFINVDVEDSEGTVLTERFQVQGVPTTAFIRKDGSVRVIRSGNIGKNDLIQEIKALIKNKKKKRGEPIAPFPLDFGSKEENISKL
jgi:thiol-disulfide isomerase/thioredoxin